MSNKKIVQRLSIAFFSVALLACSDNSLDGNVEIFHIKDAFGFVFGEMPSGLPEGYLAETQEFETTTSPAPDAKFSTYVFNVTPKTHLIYGVTAKTLYAFSNVECESLKQVYITRYEKQYGAYADVRIFNDEKQWKLQEHNSRSIILRCVMGYDKGAGNAPKDAHRLEVEFLDKSFSMKAYSEWQDHSVDVPTNVR